MKNPKSLIFIGSLCEVIITLVKIYGQQITGNSRIGEPFVTIMQSVALLVIITGFVIKCATK